MNWITGIILLMALASGAAALEADAGNDQHVSPGTMVDLDGSGSTGTGTLTYNWTEGGTVLSDQVSFSHEFSIGTHTITLTVSNGTNTDTDTVVVRVNQPPVADAGDDWVILPDTYIKLDASGSMDLDGSIASYKWTEDEVELSTRKSFNKIFGYGVHRITLTVIDDFGDQDTDCMVVMVLLRGDLNHDGVVTPADAMIALQLAACGECAAKAGADQRSTSLAAGMTPVPITQASALGMGVTDATCINVRRLTRYNPDCKIADVSGDGQVTSLDALMILQAAVGAIDL